MPRLYNPTDRKTEARIFVDDAGNEFFFSYETCIAYRGYNKLNEFMQIRRKNSWGSTTGRHFSSMGCKDFAVYSGEEFLRLLPTCSSVLE